MAELLSTTLFKFEAGAARARRIPAGYNMPAVDIIPAFIEADKAGTFVNKAVAPLPLVVKAGDKFHIALTGILAGGAFDHPQPAPTGDAKAVGQLIPPRRGAGLWVPSGNQIIDILYHKGAVA